MVTVNVDSIRKAHSQSPGDYCAVSALEFVAKCYGLVRPSEKPLQRIPENEHKGFDEKLRRSVGLSGADNQYAPDEAAKLVESETTSKRMPCVALLRPFDPKSGAPVGYHIYVASKESGEVEVIDPANGDIVAKKLSEIEQLFAENAAQNPDRDTIHVLTLFTAVFGDNSSLASLVSHHCPVLLGA